MTLFLESETAGTGRIGERRSGSWLHSQELEFAFSTWREFPDRLVGLRASSHYWDEAKVRLHFCSPGSIFLLDRALGRGRVGRQTRIPWWIRAEQCSRSATYRCWRTLMAEWRTVLLGFEFRKIVKV